MNIPDLTYQNNHFKKLQFVNPIEQKGMQKFELDLQGFGFIGFSSDYKFVQKLLKLDLYLHEHGQAYIRPAYVERVSKFTHNEKKQKVTFRKAPMPRLT